MSPSTSTVMEFYVWNTVLALNNVISAGEEHSLSWETDVFAEFLYWWQHFLRGEGGGESFLLSLTLMDVCWRAEKQEVSGVME